MPSTQIQNMFIHVREAGAPSLCTDRFLLENFLCHPVYSGQLPFASSMQNWVDGIVNTAGFYAYGILKEHSEVVAERLQISKMEGTFTNRYVFFGNRIIFLTLRKCA